MKPQLIPFSKVILISGLGLSGFWSHGQQPADRLSPIISRPMPAYIASENKTTSVLSLPVEDDFSYDDIWPNNTIWTDHHVYINQTLAISPPTLGVATFDGLNQFGLAYDLSKNPAYTDTADILTSRPIDLSSPTDSVYLSFYYQAQGLGEKPETNDSLALYFYDAEDTLWRPIWRIFGGNTVQPFKLVVIPVASTFHQNEFRFRFVSYGSQTGAFDMWHLDRILLDDQQNFDDTLFTDIAFTRPHPSLLKDYESIPWFHYNNTLAKQINKDDITLFYRKNLLPGAVSSLNLCIYQISYRGNILVQDRIGNISKDDIHQPNQEEFYDTPIGSFLLPSSPIDEFEIIGISTYTGNSLANKGPNDSVVKHQVFKNYYAYDDGSAEKIYEVDNNIAGYILAKYDIRQPDQLKGLYIYFIAGGNDATANDFQIAVFENSSGKPGSLIYLSDSLYQPSYTATNFFFPYALDHSGIQINGSVFIGIKQRTKINMTIGFDANNSSKTSIFYGNSFPLTQSFLKGNIMMRPFFRYLPRDFELSEIRKSKRNFALYPNPAKNVINLSWHKEPDEQYYFVVSDISGKTILQGRAQKQLQLDNLPDGFYVITLSSPSSKFAPISKKLVISQ